MCRFVMTGAKYEAKPLVSSLRESLANWGLNTEQPMIHAALEAGRPATAIVSTLSSERPLRPYIFRSYQLPAGVKSLYDGQCRHTWLQVVTCTCFTSTKLQILTRRRRGPGARQVAYEALRH